MKDTFIANHFANYRSYLDFKKTQNRSYLSDQEYVRLVNDYIQVLRMFRESVEEANILIFGLKARLEEAQKKDKERERTDKIQATLRRKKKEVVNSSSGVVDLKLDNVLTFSTEPAIDKVNRLRREFEYVSRQLADYKPFLKRLDVSRDNSARGFVKDVVTAQLYGDEEKGIRYLHNAIEKHQKACKEFWQWYLAAAEHEKKRSLQYFGNLLSMARGLDVSSEEIDAMYKEWIAMTTKGKK